MIVSATVFFWFNTFMVASIAILWTVWDGRLLVKLWGERKSRHDEFFGSVMGLVIVVLGVTGLIRYLLSDAAML